MERLSIEKCREILGDTALGMSDEDIIKIRGDLYTFAEIALDQYFAKKLTPATGLGTSDNVPHVNKD